MKEYLIYYSRCRSSSNEIEAYPLVAYLGAFEFRIANVFGKVTFR